MLVRHVAHANASGGTSAPPEMFEADLTQIVYPLAAILEIYQKKRTKTYVLYILKKDKTICIFVVFQK